MAAADDEGTALPVAAAQTGATFRMREIVRYGVAIYSIEMWRDGALVVASPTHLSPAGAKTWMHGYVTQLVEDERRAALH